MDRSIIVGFHNRARAAALVAFLASLGLLLGSSLAQAGWQLPATALSEPGDKALSPDVAIDPTGRTTVVWYGGPEGALAIRAATRPAGSKTFSDPVEISTPGPILGEVGIDVEAQAGGRTVVTWEEGGLVWASSRPAGSNAFSEPEQISLPPGLSTFPQIAFHPQFGALIAWQKEVVADDYVIQFSRETAPGSNQFTAPIDLSADGEIAAGADLAVGPDGQTTVVWYRDDGTGEFVAQAATSTSNLSSFSSPLNLSSGSANVVMPPRVTTGSDGVTTVVWNDASSSKTVIQSRTRAEGSAFFSPVVNISEGPDGSVSYTNTEIGTAPSGDTSVVWAEAPPGVLISTRPARGALPFSNPLNLATLGDPSGVGYFPRLAIGPSGERTVIWRSNNDFNSSVVRTSSVSSTGGLTQASAPKDISDPASFASEIAAGPNGLVTAVWLRKIGPSGADSVVEQATRMRVPKLKQPVVKGPGKAKRNRKATFKVTIRNIGDGTVTGLRIGARGKGVKASKKAGSLAAGKSKTVKVPLKFTKKGRVKVTFTVASKNAGKKEKKKTVTVK
jgi:hypothetical protein